MSYSVLNAELKPMGSTCPIHFWFHFDRVSHVCAIRLVGLACAASELNAGVRVWNVPLAGMSPFYPGLKCLAILTFASSRMFSVAQAFDAYRAEGLIEGQ